MKAAEYYSLLEAIYRQNSTERSAEFAREGAPDGQGLFGFD